MANPLVSVIILSWNRKQDILKTLEDLVRQTFKDFETVVIDQNSDDGAPDAIASAFPQVRLVRLQKNVGLSGGRNVGVKEALGKFLVFLDNDATMEDEGIAKLVRKFEACPEVGIIGCKIYNFYTRELENYSWVYPKYMKPRCDEEFETYTYCGAGHAIRREVFDRVGFYWEDLFIYWDENDLALRAIKQGIKIIYFPSVSVYHRFSPEKRFWTAKNHYLIVRNSLWVNLRSFPRPQAVTDMVVRTAAYLVKGIRRKCLLAVIKGTVDGMARIHLLFEEKERLSSEEFKRYKQLNQQGPFWWRAKTLLTGE